MQIFLVLQEFASIVCMDNNKLYCKVVYYSVKGEEMAQYASLFCFLWFCKNKKATKLPFKTFLMTIMIALV